MYQLYKPAEDGSSNVTVKKSIVPTELTKPSEPESPIKVCQIFKE